MSESTTNPPQINTKKIVFLMLAMITVTLFIPGLALIIFIGMLPTFGALISDPTKNNSQTFCVGICNMTGLGPLISDLYKHNLSLNYAYNIIHNDTNLLMILCAAAFGWGLFFIVPAITIAYYRNRDRTTLIQMVKRYDQLKKTWGDNIPTSPSVESIKSKLHNKK